MAPGAIVFNRGAVATLLALLILSSLSESRQLGSVPALPSPVSLAVTVLDNEGHPVTGLTQQDFLVYEHNRLQDITSFQADTSPVSWGLILDLSENMRPIAEDVSKAALYFIGCRRNQDEMFIVTFGDRIHTLCDFTSDGNRLRESVRNLAVSGESKLYDAVADALGNMRDAKNPRKALLLVTDGEDEGSGVRFDRLLERAGAQDTIVYSIGLFGLRKRRRFLERRGEWQDHLMKLAEVTAGAADFAYDMAECRSAMTDITTQAPLQYKMEYRPSTDPALGNWRKVSVKLLVVPRNGIGSIRTRSRIFVELHSPG